MPASRHRQPARRPPWRALLACLAHGTSEALALQRSQASDRLRSLLRLVNVRR